MSISRLEQETVINFNEAEPTATIYTHNGALTRKLEALADQRPEEAKRGRIFPDGGNGAAVNLLSGAVRHIDFLSGIHAEYISDMIYIRPVYENVISLNLRRFHKKMMHAVKNPFLQ